MKGQTVAAVVTTTWNPGRTLAIARRDARLTQQQVATHLTAELGEKVSRPLVSKWERNHAFPDINQWRALILLFEERGVPGEALRNIAWSSASIPAAA